MRFKLVRVCESKSMAAVPQESVRFDLVKASELLKNDGYFVDEQGVMLIARKGSVELTLYPNGRLLLEPAEDKQVAKRVAESFYAAIEGAT